MILILVQFYIFTLCSVLFVVILAVGALAAPQQEAGAADGVKLAAPQKQAGAADGEKLSASPKEIEDKIKVYADKLLTEGGDVPEGGDVTESGDVTSGGDVTAGGDAAIEVSPAVANTKVVSIL